MYCLLGSRMTPGIPTERLRPSPVQNGCCRCDVPARNQDGDLLVLKANLREGLLVTAQLLLVRHAAHADLGHALSGRGGGGLTADGQRQAERLAERLAAFEPAAVYASPRLRAVATASVLAGRFGLQTGIEPALDE